MRGRWIRQQSENLFISNYTTIASCVLLVRKNRPHPFGTQSADLSERMQAGIVRFVDNNDHHAGWTDQLVCGPSSRRKRRRWRRRRQRVAADVRAAESN